ncbi:MAG: Gfo/Idh/MocA family oxidoreductase, partial [Geitlerinemataceae cyanobacterium]
MSVSYLKSSSMRVEPEPIRVGVIGVGNMGQHHARVLGLLKNVELVGIADINIERGVNTASQYGVRFFEDYRNLLPHVDAVCIAVPTRLHYS